MIPDTDPNHGGNQPHCEPFLVAMNGLVTLLLASYRDIALNPMAVARSVTLKKRVKDSEDHQAWSSSLAWDILAISRYTFSKRSIFPKFPLWMEVNQWWLMVKAHVHSHCQPLFATINGHDPPLSAVFPPWFTTTNHYPPPLVITDSGHHGRLGVSVPPVAALVAMATGTRSLANICVQLPGRAIDYEMNQINGNYY